MSFSNWLHNAAIGGWLVLATVAASAQPITDKPGTQPSAQQSQPQPQTNVSPPLPESIQDILKRIASAIESQIDKPKEADEQERASRDLRAQEEMARWAFWMFVAAAAGTVLTLVGIFLIWRTLVYTRVAAVAARDMVTEGEKATSAALEATAAARRQADFAEESFRRLERPYLFVKFMRVRSLVAPGGGDHPHLEFTLVNYGKTPAILRSMFAEILIEPSFPLNAPTGTGWVTYDVIAPGEALTKERFAFVKNAEKGQGFQGDETKRLVMHGVARYEDPTGALHTDRFCLRANPQASTWTLEGGKEHNWRKTEYPERN